MGFECGSLKLPLPRSEDGFFLSKFCPFLPLLLLSYLFVSKPPKRSVCERRRQIVTDCVQSCLCSGVFWLIVFRLTRSRICFGRAEIFLKSYLSTGS